MDVREAEEQIEQAGLPVRYLDQSVAHRLTGVHRGGAVGGVLPTLRETIWALVRDPAFRAFVLRLVKIAREEWERLKTIIEKNGGSDGGEEADG